MEAGWGVPNHVASTHQGHAFVGEVCFLEEELPGLVPLLWQDLQQDFCQVLDQQGGVCGC